MRTDALGKLDEERFTSFSRLLLVLESRALISATRELDEIDAGSLELLGHGEGLFGVESTIGEIGRVDLDGNDELGIGDGLANALDDLKDDAGSSLEVTTVLVGSSVDTGGEELREKVSVSSVELDTVALGIVEDLGGETESSSNVVDLVDGQRTGLAEGHSHTRRALNVGRRDRSGGNLSRSLATGVGDLSNHERTVCLGSINDGLVSLDVLVVRRNLGIDTGILLGFRVSGIARNVAEDDGADLSLAPSLVELDVLGGGPATLLEIVVGPSAETLGHGTLESGIGRRKAVGEDDGLLENFEMRHYCCVLGYRCV